MRTLVALLVAKLALTYAVASGACEPKPAPPAPPTNAPAAPAADVPRVPEREGFDRSFLCATSVSGVMRRGEPTTAKAEVLMTLRYDEPRADVETCSQLRATGCTASVAWVEIIACSDPTTGSSSILYAETSEVHRPGQPDVAVTQPYFGHFVAELAGDVDPADLAAPGTFEMQMSLEGRRYRAALTLSADGHDDTGCGADRFSMTPSGAPALGGAVVSCARPGR